MIGIREKIGYGFGDMASSMFWKLFGSYLMIFYTDVFGMPAAVVGTMFLITRVWDSAFDPIIGVIADRTQSRWGKFRPYLLYLAVPFAVIGVLTFTTPDFSDGGKVIYAYLTYSLMMMGIFSYQCALCFVIGSNECGTERSEYAFYISYDFRLYRKFYSITSVYADG